MSLREDIARIDTSKRALRSFGHTVGPVLLGLAALVLWRRGWTMSPALWGLTSAGAFLLLFGFLAPFVLRPIYRAWMVLAFLLGFVTTRVVLSLVFFLVLTPIAWYLRLKGGQDLLDERVEPERSSYWLPKTYRDDSPERLKKLY